MLHIEIEGITHEMERVVLRHIACRGHMGDIIAFGERRLDEAVIGRLRGIENHGIVSRCETDSRLDGLLGLHIVDIHTEGVDDRRRDTLQGQTEGIEIEDLDRLEDSIRRIIAVLGRRDLIGTRRKTSLEETLAVGILLEHLAGLHIGDFDSNTAQRERAILIIHIDSHTRRRRLRVLLRGFLMARQIEPNGELSAYEERIHFRILCRSGHEGRVGREVNRVRSHCHLRRDILCTLYLFVTQGIEHAVIRKEGYAQTGSGLDPSVKVHTDLRTGCQVEAEVHIGSRTLHLLIRYQRMLVHVVQTGDELLILDGGSHNTADGREAEYADTGFDTGLPEEGDILELHTKEEGHLDESADDLIVQLSEVIMISHGVGIRRHTIGEGECAVRAVSDRHDGVIGIELRAHGHQELLVTELVSQAEASTDVSFVLILEADRVGRTGSIIEEDAGGEEVGITDLPPETETMGDVAFVISVRFGVRLIDLRYSGHVLRFLFGCREGRLGLRRSLGYLFGRRGRFGRFGLSLLGFGFIAVFLLLNSGFRLLFFLLLSGFLAILGCFGLGFLALLRHFSFLFLALCFGFCLSVHRVNSRNAIIHYGGYRSYRSEPHRHQKYADDSFHVLIILDLGYRREYDNHGRPYYYHRYRICPFSATRMRSYI